MSYHKDNESRGLGAIAAADMGIPVRGPVPPFGVVPRGIGIRSAGPQRFTPARTPPGVRVAPPPPVLRQVAIVSPPGRPLARVSPAPTQRDPARVAVVTAARPPLTGAALASARMRFAAFQKTHPGSGATMDAYGAIHVKKPGATLAKGKVIKGKGHKPGKKPVWVTKAKDCPKGYFVKKTVVTITGMKFWCWPNPATKPKKVVRHVTGRRPTVKVKTRPVTHARGVRISSRIGTPAANIRGPVFPVSAAVPPMTSVDTEAGPAMVIQTSAGNVAVPGAVPVPPDVPVGSTISTDAGPATVVDTPSGNVGIPESMAPPEDSWGSDAMIDELLGETKEAVAAETPPGEPVPPEAAPGALITVAADGPVPDATPAEEKGIKKEETKAGVSKAAVIGGGLLLAMKFFL